MPNKSEYKIRPLSRGGVMLRMWMQRQNHSLRSMCSEMDWNPTSIHSYIAGDKKPSLGMAHEIFRKTGVPMNAWLEEN